MNTADAILGRFLDALGRRDFGQVGSLLDDQVTLEFPFAPDGLPRSVKGRPAADELLAAILTQMFSEFAFYDVCVEALADPSSAIATFRSEGTIAGSGRPYRNSYICIARCRGERIHLYREYFDPVVAMQAGAPG